MVPAIPAQHRSRFQRQACNLKEMNVIVVANCGCRIHYELGLKKCYYPQITTEPGDLLAHLPLDLIDLLLPKCLSMHI
jgi:hypothetical protein